MYNDLQLVLKSGAGFGPQACVSYEMVFPREPSSRASRLKLDVTSGFVHICSPERVRN